jgi:acyl-coenzyme A thioesterase PaaI-like protein
MEVLMQPNEWRPMTNIAHECFGCGQHNHQGLKMRFFTNEQQVRSDLVIPGHLRGWSNLAHGGVITTVLDEVMGWAGMYLLNQFLLTRDIKVRFKLPVRIGEPVSVYGFIAEQKNDRQVIVAAELRNAKGQVAAKAEGYFALFSAEKFAAMNIMPADELERMKGMFSSVQREQMRVMQAESENAGA